MMPAASAAASAARARPLARARRFAARHRLIGFIFILPWLVSFLWLDVYPFFAGLYLSCTDYSVGRVLPHWLGLANYVEIFTSDPLLMLALKNTVYYLALQVPAMLVISFTMALILNSRNRGATVFRTLYYIPVVVPSVAASMLWIWLLDARRGLVNMTLALVGITGPSWLTDPNWTKPSLILVTLWGLGSQMVIFLAGLQGVAQEYYEAAAIDGAGRLGRLWHITTPLMTPTIFFNLVMGIIAAFQVFGSAWVMMGGPGPANSTLFYMIHIYRNAFAFFRMGYAAALSVVLFAIILSLTLIVNASSGRWVHYE